MIHIAYIRVSTRDQHLEQHQRQLDDHEIRLGIKITHVFADFAQSGGKMDRKDYLRMMDFISKNFMSGITVHTTALDRITRNNLLWIYFTEKLTKYNCILVSTTMGVVDYKSAMGKYLTQSIINSAEYMKNTALERSTIVTNQNLRRGYWQSNYPAGYMEGKNEHNERIGVRREPEASIISKMFAMFANDDLSNVPDCREYLKNRGIKISKSHIYATLKKIIYTGYYRDRLTENLIQGKHDVIVPLPIFEQVQKKLEKQSRKTWNVYTATTFPLKLKTRCIECGRYLTGYEAKSCTGKKYRYYRCHGDDCLDSSTSIPAKELEKIYIEELKKCNIPQYIADDVSVVIRHLANKNYSENKQSFDSMERSIEGKSKRISNAINTLIDTDNISIRSSVERKIIQLEAERKELEKNIFEVKSRMIVTDEKLLEQKATSASELLTNLDVLFTKSDTEGKNRIHNLIFSAPLCVGVYTRVRTSTFTEVGELLREIKSKNLEWSPQPDDYRTILSSESVAKFFEFLQFF
jgi:site-specific DNA recombinase